MKNLPTGSVKMNQMSEDSFRLTYLREPAIHPDILKCLAFLASWGVPILSYYYLTISPNIQSLSYLVGGLNPSEKYERQLG